MVTVHACLASQTLLGCWTFEEGAGTTTADLSGNGHTGSLGGTPKWDVGAKGRGLNFDTFDDFVDVGSRFFSAGVNQLTVSAWVNPTSFSNQGDIAVGGVSGPRIISTTDGGGWALGHAPGSGSIQLELRHIGLNLTLGTFFPLNQWSHVAVVYDGASVKTYLNGQPVDSRSAPAGTAQKASTCTFIGNEPEGCGRQTNGNFAWQGGIDEVAVYGHALAPEEVLALYQR